MTWFDLINTIIPIGLIVIALLAMTGTQSTSGDYVERDWRVG